MKKYVVVGLGVQGLKRIKYLKTRNIIKIDPFKRADYSFLKEVPKNLYDTVFICVPDKEKEELVEYCIKHKKHFLVEKPFPILKETKIKSILDPCMRNGNILYKISEEFETKEIYGFERNNSLFRLSEIFNKNAQLYNDYFPNKKNLDKKFDLIISIPPFNLFDTSISNNLVIKGKEQNMRKIC